MTAFLTMFQGGLGALGGLLPMLLIIGVFYMLLIRPQQKGNGIAANNRRTQGGRPRSDDRRSDWNNTTVRDTSFLIRSADKSILEIARSAIAGIEGEEEKK